MCVELARIKTLLGCGLTSVLQSIIDAVQATEQDLIETDSRVDIFPLPIHQ